VRGIVCNLVLYLLMEKGRFKKSGEGYPIIILGKRKSPFISFYSLFGIETFQGVTAEKVKKYWTPSTRASGCPQSSQAARSLLHLFSLAPPALPRARNGFVQPKVYAWIPGLSNTLFAATCVQQRNMVPYKLLRKELNRLHEAAESPRGWTRRRC
jgi:hypothetical protein